MALSEYEKKVLAQMEADFRKGDPDLVDQMTSAAKASAEESPKGRITPKRIAAGATLAVVGVAVLVGAVSMGYSVWSIVVGVIAFALMVGGILYALTPVASTGAGRVAGRAAKAPKRRKPGSSWRDFIEDQERRWDDRRDAD